MYSVLNYHNVAKHIKFYLGELWFNDSLVMQGASKRASQRYSKCYCVASVTKTFTLKGVQTIHRSTAFVRL
jgi:hypothetical protein